VSEWEVLCLRESEKEEGTKLRRMMSESICRLAKSGRELIYNRASENSATVKMTLGPDIMCQTNISGAITGRSPPDTG
jgi:hypothetical protein